ncbi:MAG TPA: aldose 1-epimerase [Solirubrobacteraceae bacterium]|nr:aldose 1-epimerase [Solirubrobacteraceae bacterium]
MAYELSITDGFIEATFVPEVGMVGNSLRHEGEELLFQRDGLAGYSEHGSVFGIPLLHPWANRLSAWEFELEGQRVELDPEARITHRDAPTNTPIHGLLAASPHWQVIDADRDTLTAELDFAAVPEYMAAFPFPHRVRYAATVQEGALTIALTVIATGEIAVPVSFGFHPYFTLPGSDRRDWQIQLPVALQAIVDERQIPTGETVAIEPGELDGPLRDRTFDTSYPALHGSTFTLADNRRKLTLTHVRGYPVTQVFAPENSDFICFEPMTAPVDALITGDGLNWVAPGGEFTAIFAIAIEEV